MAGTDGTPTKAEELGRHFIICLQGYAIGDEGKHLLSELKPGGILLRQQNFMQGKPYAEWLNALQQFLTTARQYTGREKLIVAIDHEGGRVYRTPPPLTKFCYAGSYAHKAVEVARAMALELSSIGVNLFLGPVADIHSNPTNPVIGPRAFGTTAQAVIDSAIPFAAALIEAGLAFCPKHFPGHGDTSQDSHFELPRVETDKHTLEAREFLPFKALVKAGAAFVMTSHIMFPAIDKDLPATMSKKLLCDVLRKTFSFNGVVVSDDLDMRAISENYSLAQVAQHSLAAGCDMFIFNHKPQRALEMAKEMLKLLKDGLLSQNLLNESASRIQNALQKSIRASRVQALSAETFELHKNLSLSLPEREEFKGIAAAQFEPK